MMFISSVTPVTGRLGFQCYGETPFVAFPAPLSSGSLQWKLQRQSGVLLLPLLAETFACRDRALEWSLCRLSDEVIDW